MFFLWLDKFHLCVGVQHWLVAAGLDVVDMITWDKGRLGMGYRTRRCSEHVMVLQKPPRRAKGIWTRHDIPDVWRETVAMADHVHRKPMGLQVALIEAVSHKGDTVIDPAAGSFSVMEACQKTERIFVGCDVNG